MIEKSNCSVIFQHVKGLGPEKALVEKSMKRHIKPSRNKKDLIFVSAISSLRMFLKANQILKPSLNFIQPSFEIIRNRSSIIQEFLAKKRLNQNLSLVELCRREIFEEEKVRPNENILCLQSIVDIGIKSLKKLGRGLMFLPKKCVKFKMIL